MSQPYKKQNPSVLFKAAHPNQFRLAVPQNEIILKLRGIQTTYIRIFELDYWKCQNKTKLANSLHFYA